MEIDIAVVSVCLRLTGFCVQIQIDNHIVLIDSYRTYNQGFTFTYIFY